MLNIMNFMVAFCFTASEKKYILGSRTILEVSVAFAR
jgi:hypothetical protein